VLYPAISELVKHVGNRYSLVIATAKRARQIAQRAEAEGEPLTEKPVKTAINEIYEGKVVYRMPDEAGSSEQTSAPARRDDDAQAGTDGQNGQEQEQSEE